MFYEKLVAVGYNDFNHCDFHFYAFLRILVYA